ncbi:hypothetical protein C5S53_02165, partial [Methanophagales archaeon]
MEEKEGKQQSENRPGDVSDAQTKALASENRESTVTSSQAE